MDELDVGVDRAKQAAAWVTEKAGRLKPNGQLLGYSPLSPLIELEALSLGIEGKRLLWVVLRETVADRVGAERLDALAERAAHQRTDLEPYRVAAAARAAVA